jgi:hypothetical protein
MFDPIEPFIALLYVAAAGLLLRAAGREPGEETASGSRGKSSELTVQP